MKIWLDGERLIIAHRYGGCYGVVTVGNTGIDADEELSELPPGAVELDDLLEDARSYIDPTISTHEEISAVLGWCDCGYCIHVPRGRP
jgi:hypothetical protein